MTQYTDFLERQLVKDDAILAKLTAVKPLDFANCLKHAFLSGVVAARNIPGHEPCDGPTLWTSYEPYTTGSYSRVTTALGTVVAKAVQDCTTCSHSAESSRDDPCYPCFWAGKYTNWEAQ